MSLPEDDDDYPRRRGRRLATRVVAVVLIVALVVAFPLGYLVDAELQGRHIEAVIAIIEVVLVATLVAVVRASRRRL